MKKPGAAYELGYIKMGVELLDAYLQSDELYWAMAASPPAGEPPYRQLTLGGLLLNERRLQGRQLPQAVDLERQECLTHLQDAISRRPVAWERKATREYQARLKLWGDFLQEYRDDPENHAGRYAYEVERRVMLQLLEPYARDVHRAERELLDALDGILKVAFVSGTFIWNLDTIRAFPKDIYWYLYGDLRK
jgi:hypothetical protein